MPRRGPIRLPDQDDDLPPAFQLTEPAEVILPDLKVVQAGVAKFLELARLNWPSQEGGFKLTGFDIRNTRQLGMTLGLVYMAMRGEDDGKHS